MPRLVVSICFAKAPGKEIPESFRNSFKILVLYSLVYSDSFGQDNAHSEETMCPPTLNCHYMVYDFLHGMNQINNPGKKKTSYSVFGCGLRYCQ